MLLPQSDHPGRALLEPERQRRLRVHLEIIGQPVEKLEFLTRELASAVGSSRSVISERFARFLGEPPLTYLARWRLQLAARLLQTTQKNVLQVAFDTGYESEASFNRAFKREFGLPPAQYRKELTGRKRQPVWSRLLGHGSA